ncbi:MAG: DUF1801 domain-containing protein [Bacteroidia bacterium]
MGKKGAMQTFNTVDEHIKVQSTNAQILLTELRSIIKETVPETIEIPDSKVPSFTLVPGKKPELQIMMMAYSKGISFYPFEGAVKHFSNQLKGFELGKGTIKFPFNKTLPVDLIKEIIAFRKSEIIQNKL